MSLKSILIPTEQHDLMSSALETALLPISEAAHALGAPPEDARLLMVDTFAHAAGLLLLAHTGRIRMFAASAPRLMERYVEDSLMLLNTRHKKLV